MTTLYVTEPSGRKRKAILIECEFCGEDFPKAIVAINRSKHNYCSTTCSQYAQRKRIKVQCTNCGIDIERTPSDLSESKTGLFFCSYACKHKAMSYKKELNTSLNIPTYRTLAFMNNEPICNRCGFSNKEALQVHHIDRNRENNALSNLEILCANCHMIEHRVKVL